MKSKQKLELTWIGKEKRPKLEPRILVEDPRTLVHAWALYDNAGAEPAMLEWGENA